MDKKKFKDRMADFVVKNDKKIVTGLGVVGIGCLTALTGCLVKLNLEFNKIAKRVSKYTK